MRSRFRSGVTLAVAVAAAVSLVQVSVAGPATAHNALAASTPADGARLAHPPASVRLTFLSRLDPATSKILVTGPDGASVAARGPVYAGSKVTVALRPGTAAGRYLIAYRVASDDGHPVEGAVRFTVTGGPAPAASGAGTPGAGTPAAGGTAAPDTAAPSGAGIPPGRPDRDRSAAAQLEGDGLPWWPLALGVALLAAGAGLLLARRLRSQRAGQPGR